MLTAEQEKWISHLSSKKIKIIPYNPKTKIVFQKIKKEIQKNLGKVDVKHRGATSLGISGQGEIDLYIPVSKFFFDKYLKKLITFLGKPGSVYPLERVRFVKFIDNIKIEIFLINKETDNWKNGVKFESYLKKHPEFLKKYEKLKEQGDGLTMQKYYRRKIEFINKILDFCS